MYIIYIPYAKVLEQATVLFQLIFKRFVRDGSSIVPVGILKHCHCEVFNLCG